jgi:hypothetical protein
MIKSISKYNSENIDITVIRKNSFTGATQQKITLLKAAYAAYFVNPAAFCCSSNIGVGL